MKAKSVPEERIELSTSRLGVGRSNPLSYTGSRTRDLRLILERMLQFGQRHESKNGDVQMYRQPMNLYLCVSSKHSL